MRLLRYVAAALCTPSLAACATIIDFSTLPNGIVPLTTYSEYGYTVTTTAGDFGVTPADGDPSPAVYAPASGTLTVTTGGLFTYSSLAFGEVEPFFTTEVFVTGLLGGKTVFTNGYYGGVPDYFFTLTNPFDSDPIDSLQIQAENFTAIDNISVVAVQAPSTVTPEPSSIALLGTGLFGVVGLIKRRFASPLRPH